jgi:hypothetical protein
MLTFNWRFGFNNLTYKDPYQAARIGFPWCTNMLYGKISKTWIKNLSTTISENHVCSTLTFETSANSAGCHERLHTIENNSYKKFNDSFSITKNE